MKFGSWTYDGFQVKIMVMTMPIMMMMMMLWRTDLRHEVRLLDLWWVSGESLTLMIVMFIMIIEMLDLWWVSGGIDDAMHMVTMLKMPMAIHLSKRDRLVSWSFADGFEEIRIWDFGGIQHSHVTLAVSNYPKSNVQCSWGRQEQATPQIDKHPISCSVVHQMISSMHGCHHLHDAT